MTSFPPAAVRVFVHRFQGQVWSVPCCFGEVLGIAGTGMPGSLGKRLLGCSQASVPSLWACQPTEHS